MKKIHKGLIPNPGIFIEHDHESRNGTSFRIPTRNETNKKWTSNERKSTFHYRGPQVFNALPRDLRDSTESMECFKIKLDTFLDMIPDNPIIGNPMKSLILNNPDN